MAAVSTTGPWTSLQTLSYLQSDALLNAVRGALSSDLRRVFRRGSHQSGKAHQSTAAAALGADLGRSVPKRYVIRMPEHV